MIRPYIFDFDSMTSSVIETISRHETHTRSTTEVEEALAAYADFLKRSIARKDTLIQKIDALYRTHGIELK